MHVCSQCIVVDSSVLLKRPLIRQLTFLATKVHSSKQELGKEIVKMKNILWEREVVFSPRGMKTGFIMLVFSCCEGQVPGEVLGPAYLKRSSIILHTYIFRLFIYSCIYSFIFYFCHVRLKWRKITPENSLLSPLFIACL